jgi:hypothetical protein
LQYLFIFLLKEDDKHIDEDDEHIQKNNGFIFFLIKKY